MFSLKVFCFNISLTKSLNRGVPKFGDQRDKYWKKMPTTILLGTTQRSCHLSDALDELLGTGTVLNCRVSIFWAHLLCA